MTASQRAFWVRFIATAFIVNTPLAIAVVTGALTLPIGFGLSAGLGVALLLIWDGGRGTNTAGVVDARVVQVAEPALETATITQRQR